MGARRHEEDLSERLYNALLADYPDHAPGTRPVHANGICAKGYFVASEVARRFSLAEQFQGRCIRVTVRFSNGSGSRVETDNALDVRGMATKFHLSGDQTADLIMITLPVFFAATPKKFLDFAEAGTPEPMKPKSRWGRLMDTLRLRPPEPPLDPDVLAYANRHVGARPGLAAAVTLVTPASYARARYHSLHTFELTSEGGTVRYGRFTWEPVAGVRPEEKQDVFRDYLHAELEERLRRAPARFVLRMVLASQGDALDDPAKSWDTTRMRVVMGELVLTGLIADCEGLSFNPTRVVRGFECSDDPVLASRRDAYEYSCRQRGGTGCPVGR